MSATFRKKPVVVEAIQWNGNNFQELNEFLAKFDFHLTPSNEEASCTRCLMNLDRSTPPALIIPTLEGDHWVNPGDWIIRGIKGEFYPCKPDIFDMTYEPC